MERPRRGGGEAAGAAGPPALTRVHDDDVIHFTSGDRAADALRALGVDGVVVPWRDVLHEGPVPAGLPLPELSAVRARFIAAQGWGGEEDVLGGFRERDAALTASADEDEVVLWFEHDLYDQLQLLQLLDWFAVHGSERQRLTLVAADDYLTSVGAARLRRWLEERRPATTAQLAQGYAAWAAFRANDPRAVERILTGDTSPLPHLAAALRRHLEQFPGARDGLSRSERQALEALAEGPLPVRDVYRRSHHESESAVFLGDIVFVSYLAALAGPPHPLVTWEDGRPITSLAGGSDAVSAARSIALTETGRDVLAGRADRVRLVGIDRWLGGVHLSASHPDWRWDADAGRIVLAV